MIRPFFILTALAFAQSASANPGEAGMIKTTNGQVTVNRAGQALNAKPGMAVMAADQVMTGEKSTVGITLRDNTMLSAGPKSNLALDRFSFDPQSQKGELKASIKRGTLGVISGKLAKSSPDAVAFKTPTVTLGVRGTEFIIDVADREE